MNVLLVRHGKKARDLRDVSDMGLPLSDQGRTEVRSLAVELTGKKLRASLYLSSRYAHAIETARLLAEELGGDSVAEVVPVDTLTPHNPYTFGLVVQEAAKLGFDLHHQDTVGMVLHYPRIHQLTAEITSQPLEAEDPGSACATCVSADSLAQLLQGEGYTRHVWRRTTDRVLIRRDY
jgi:phosphohistidine phosphatase SixA